MFSDKNIDIRLKYSDSDEKLWTNKKKNSARDQQLSDSKFLQ